MLSTICKRTIAARQSTLAIKPDAHIQVIDGRVDRPNRFVAMATEIVAGFQQVLAGNLQAIERLVEVRMVPRFLSLGGRGGSDARIPANQRRTNQKHFAQQTQSNETRRSWS